MARNAKSNPRQAKPATPGPTDAVDGIPDRSKNRSPWKYAVLGGLFLAWVAFLIACRVIGSP